VHWEPVCFSTCTCTCTCKLGAFFSLSTPLSSRRKSKEGASWSSARVFSSAPGNMYGSCCEEQDAQEAKVRARVAEIKRITEDRLMRGHKVRENMRRSMRPTHFGGCPDPCCDGCGGCDEDEVDGESGETDAAGDPSIRAKQTGNNASTMAWWRATASPGPNGKFLPSAPPLLW
jgi:hypothetical protein